MSGYITRFAPSPTGLLHLGHAAAALFAQRAARDSGGRFLLRLEYLDAVRSRPAFEKAILEDISWLGLPPDAPPLRQSTRTAAYRGLLQRLQTAGVLYPCFCSRADIHRELEAMLQAPQGPDGPLYPGICRDLSPARRRTLMRGGAPYALRLDAARALSHTGPLVFRDLARGQVAVRADVCGDVILARKDAAAGYHLAVTADDAFQQVSLVTRGIDLLPATHVHRMLQALLGLPAPLYHHHQLLAGADGRRYAKREDAVSLRSLRQAGFTAAAVRELAALPPPGDDGDILIRVPALGRGE